mgnify:CR=1 FL=1
MHGADGAGGVVHGHGNEVGIRHVGNLFRLQQATRLLDVWLDDVGRLLCDQVLKAPAGVQILAAADGRVGRGRCHLI